MSASTSKRVVLYRFDRQPLEAVVSTVAYTSSDHVEILTRDAGLQIVTFQELKALCFVSENERADLFERHKSFDRRPKTSGLWVSFQFRDDDYLEGILPSNLLEWPREGFLFSPPHAGSNRQRVFIPKLAVTATVLRGVIGTTAALPATQPRKKPAESDQLTMFE